MEIDINLNKRIEWIKQRVGLDSITEQYVRFQMQEAVIEALSVVEKLSQHDVSHRSEQLVCPNCKSVLISEKPFYYLCHHCGQKFRQTNCD